MYSQPELDVILAAASPDDPSLTEPSEGAPPILSRSRAKLLFEEGKRWGVDMRKKALANDDCGKKFSHLGCDRHKKVQIVGRQIVHMCKNRFSNCCAPYIELLRMRKRKELIEDLEGSDLHGDHHLYFLSVDVPCERIPVSIKAFHKKFRMTIDSVLERAVRKISDKIGEAPGYLWEAAINGFRRNRIVASTIMMSELTSIQVQTIRLAVREAFGSEAQFRFHEIVSRFQVRESFAQMFRIIVPESEEAQAQLEVAFHGLAMTSHGQVNCDDVFPFAAKGNDVEDAPLDSQNDDRTDIVGWLHDMKCPVCGAPANVISASHPVGTPQSVVQDGDWYPLFST
jgi:hypothetical protein